MDALLNSIVAHFADRPGWLIAILCVLIVGLCVLIVGLVARLILSNPKFWDIMKHSLTQNTKLTAETLATVKLIAERQTAIKNSVDAHDDLLCRVIDDVDALSKEVASLQKTSCTDQLCPTRQQNQAQSKVA